MEAPHNLWAKVIGQKNYQKNYYNRCTKGSRTKYPRSTYKLSEEEAKMFKFPKTKGEKDTIKKDKDTVRPSNYSAYVNSLQSMNRACGCYTQIKY